MSTTRSAISLDKVGAALVEANDVLAKTADEELVEEALVALCRAAYDTLVTWEMTAIDAERTPDVAPETWRTPLDELRVQAALAELELRAAGAPGVAAADRLVKTVSSRLAAGRREIGEALDSLRTELRKSLP